mmetsp:Transcript_105076/g.203491  ORF Transcript_105076/g.203491 Transcript_105076/m.203491 type:complete len:290 (-) Transcript_105076:22-891(-)
MVAKFGGDDDLGDVYQLLGVAENANDKEIQTAYRRGSLTCHPDRNPDDPEATQKFERLTRAKELLLDPVERARIDQHQRAKRELEERYAQEDTKRRKMREDLESREERADLFAAEGLRRKEETRKRNIQADFAGRIKEREAKHAKRQADVVAQASDVHTGILESQIRLKWRDGKPSAAAADKMIKEHLATYTIQAIEATETGVLVQLGSREEALQAVLRCREKRQQFPFCASLAHDSAVTKPNHCDAHHNETHQAQPKSTCSNFEQWEASMLDGLRNFAAAQRTARTSG